MNSYSGERKRLWELGRLRRYADLQITRIGEKLLEENTTKPLTGPNRVNQ